MHTCNRRAEHQQNDQHMIAVSSPATVLSRKTAGKGTAVDPMRSDLTSEVLGLTPHDSVWWGLTQSFSPRSLGVGHYENPLTTILQAEAQRYERYQANFCTRLLDALSAASG